MTYSYYQQHAKDQIQTELLVAILEEDVDLKEIALKALQLGKNASY